MKNAFTPTLWLCLACAVVVSACTGSDGGEAASTTTTSDAPPITAEPLPEIDPTPNAPTGLVVARSGEGAVELEWDASRDETVTGYELTRVSPSGETAVFDVAVPSFLDEDVVDDQVYTYLLKAVGSGGTSEGGEPITVKVGVDDSPPKKPSRPVLVENEEGLTISWGEVSDFSGIETYLITRTIGDETVELDAGNETTYVDDLPAGTIVTYSVRAVDRAGNESIGSRNTTILSGTPADGVIIVVSAQESPQDTAITARVERELLEAGYTISWFEDNAFDANLTTSEDVVVLLGDVQGDGFDWSLFTTDAHIIGMKSMFIQSGGILDTPPKLDRLAQLDYLPPGKDQREVAMTTTDRPKPVVYIPPNEIIPSFETWARPVWSDDIAVAGLIPEGGELANEKIAPGCRAFFPGNGESLSEQTDAAWNLMVEFIGDVRAACVDA